MSRARHGKKTGMVPVRPGGEAPIAIPGKAVMQESKERSKGFAKGGAAKGGMMAGGDCGPGGRMDKPMRKSRGGATTMRGRSPMSAAASITGASTKTTH